MQTSWASSIGPVIDRAQNKSTILPKVSLTAGTNIIQHGLGYPLSGWIVVRNRGVTKNDFTTGDATSGSQSIATVGSTIGLLVGYLVSGAGIPSGTAIIGLTASAIIMNQEATASASGISLSFSGTPQFFDLQETNSTPQKTLVIISSDAAVVDLEVF